VKIFSTYFPLVFSDNELDTKLELFKSIGESSTSLVNIVEKYKDGLHQLTVETSHLGSFLRDCGKNSASSEVLMTTAGKVICYLSTQHFSSMSTLTRTLQELNTFKRAVNDTKETITLMEKERTEYRSSLALMKACSTDIDPDSGRGLEKFRTSQKYVKFAKQKFDKYSLACLQKVKTRHHLSHHDLFTTFYRVFRLIY
jgi:Arfaptin-like domain